MPWWVIIYLVLLTIIISIALIKDYRDQRGSLYILAELLSGAIGFLLVYAWFHPNLSHSLGWIILPLLIYAIVWDQYALRHMKKSSYPDLSAQENADMDKYAKVFALLFILPCYIAGALISWQLITA